VLQILRENKFYAKMKKCTFFKPETNFLGHVVGEDGIKPDPMKVAVVNNWPAPKTVKEVRSFLGFTNYFRRFIQGFAQLTPTVERPDQERCSICMDKRLSGVL
jgi:hypothetical protein